MDVFHKQKSSSDQYTRTYTHTHSIYTYYVHKDHATATRLTLFKYPGSLHNVTTTYLSSHQWYIDMSHDRRLQSIFQLSKMMHQCPGDLVGWLGQDTADVPLT